MIPPHPDILTVRDAEILRLLQKVVDIGAYRKSFTADDVARVVNLILNGHVRITVKPNGNRKKAS